MDTARTMEEEEEAMITEYYTILIEIYLSDLPKPTISGAITL